MNNIARVNALAGIKKIYIGCPIETYAPRHNGGPFGILHLTSNFCKQ